MAKNMARCSFWNWQSTCSARQSSRTVWAAASYPSRYEPFRNQTGLCSGFFWAIPLRFEFGRMFVVVFDMIHVGEAVLVRSTTDW